MSIEKQKVYLAGGLSSNWQHQVIEKLSAKFIFYNPRQHDLPKSEEYTAWDIHFVKQCDILFAYLENDNPSGFGLTFEVGYARALRKTIILVDEKSNNDIQFAHKFKIVQESSDVVFEDLSDGIQYLETYSILH